MREIDTQALIDVAPSLGIGNPATATGQVLFDDENLQQVLEVSAFVRRAQAPADGLGLVQMANIHPGADSQTQLINPWEDGAGDQRWPTARLANGELDLWLLYCYARRTGGAGDFTQATLRLNNVNTGIRRGEGNGAEEPEVRIAGFTTMRANGDFEEGDGRMWIPLGIRFPRNPELNTRLKWSTTSDAAANFACNIGVALIPSGLGQDGAF